MGLKPAKGRHTIPWKFRLAYELQDILGEPLNKVKKSDAYKAIKATFKVITEALLRGEEVYIYGFGTFKVRTRKARKRSVHWMYKYDPKIKMTPSNSPMGIISVPEQKYIHFSPCSALKKLVNEGYEDYEP